MTSPPTGSNKIVNTRFRRRLSSLGRCHERSQDAGGDVIQVMLPTGRYAYGRVLRDASVAFYRGTTAEPGLPPIGSRDYQFVVGVYDDVPGSEGAPVVGHDSAQGPEDDWPPPNSVRDPISGAMRIYHHGHLRPATPEEAEGLEPAAA
jgi:hypothetical protein